MSEKTEKKTSRGQGGRESKTASLHEARLAGVGLGDGRQVGKQTMQRVQNSSLHFGSERNELASGGKVSRSGAVGIVVPDIGGAFIAECIHAAQEVFRQNKYISVIAFTNDDPDRERTEIEYLLRRQIDGILLVPAVGAPSKLDRSQFQNMPLVVFDQPLKGFDVDEVMVSNQASAEKATEHLIWHRHKSIAYVSVDLDVPTLRARLKGYRKAMKAAELPEQVFHLGPGGEGAQELLDSWIKAKRRPTAILSSNELTSVEMLHAIAMRSVRLPEDFAMISFDDVRMGHSQLSPITAIRQPAKQLGQRAATMLMERVAEGLHEAPRKVVLDTELIIRSSCGCKPTK
jgi:LacI family transcriptional regulator